MPFTYPIYKLNYLGELQKKGMQYDAMPASEREAMRATLKISPMAPLLVYAGSLGEQYCLPEMLAFFRAVRQRRLIPVARHQHLSANLDPAARLLVTQWITPNQIPFMSLVARSSAGPGAVRTAVREAQAARREAEMMFIMEARLNAAGKVGLRPAAPPPPSDFYSTLPGK